MEGLRNQGNLSYKKGNASIQTPTQNGASRMKSSMTRDHGTGAPQQLVSSEPKKSGSNGLYPWKNDCKSMEDYPVPSSTVDDDDDFEILPGSSSSSVATNSQKAPGLQHPRKTLGSSVHARASFVKKNEAPSASGRAVGSEPNLDGAKTTKGSVREARNTDKRAISSPPTSPGSGNRPRKALKLAFVTSSKEAIEKTKERKETEDAEQGRTKAKLKRPPVAPPSPSREPVIQPSTKQKGPSDAQSRAQMKDVIMNSANQNSNNYVRGNLAHIVPQKVKDLKECPFCHKSLPPVLTSRTVEMMQTLLDRYHTEGSFSIDPTDSIGVCIRHEDEGMYIKQGFERKWPQRHDWRSLMRRVQLDRHWSLMKRRIKDPSGSQWFIELKESMAKHGRKALSVAMQMDKMSEQRAGYYGEIGWEKLLRFLGVHFTGASDKVVKGYSLNDTNVAARISPIPAATFLHSVLMPELICSLLAEDLENLGLPCSVSDAKKLRDESTRYGNALFPAEGGGIDVEELQKLVVKDKLAKEVAPIPVEGSSDDENEPKSSAPPRKTTSTTTYKARPLQPSKTPPSSLPSSNKLVDDLLALKKR